MPADPSSPVCVHGQHPVLCRRGVDLCRRGAVAACPICRRAACCYQSARPWRRVVSGPVADRYGDHHADGADPPPFLSLVNYQVPIWAVLIGVVILSETLPGHFVTALIVILGGVAISQFADRLRRA